MPNKCTPGTWTYNPDFSAVVVIHDYKVKAVADFGKTDLPETEANARLMAASKEMFEALQVAESKLAEIRLYGNNEIACTDELQQVRAAIAKAQS